jgi:type III secretion protein C
VGISLSITPVVGNNDVITLMIEEDISEQIDTATGSSVTTDKVSGITTSKNTTKVVVSVPDKSVLVLSGTIQDSKTRNKTGIPCLGGLPLIGAAFSENNYSRTVQNIVFFVRPQIIKSFDVYSEITARQEEIFGELSGEIEDFDAGLELVKTPDDTY